jgi:hypothetical protein
MRDITVGQVWQDKDKRRSTVIEILSVTDTEAVGLVVGTEIERVYRLDRLAKRWALVADKSDVLVSIEDIRLIDLSIIEEKHDKPKHKTREQWLEAAVKELTKLFVRLPEVKEVPKVRVSVGWPGGRGKKANVIGQCFATSSTEDKIAQIFVSPVVADPLKALVVMAHELVHAIDDGKSGHKTGFIKIARELGFTPKWTIATPETITDELKAELEEIAEKLGTYPHSAIRPTERPQTQKTYMLKVVSPEDPDFFVRMTAGKIEDYGFPRDPWGNEMELEES